MSTCRRVIDVVVRPLRIARRWLDDDWWFAYPSYDSHFIRKCWRIDNKITFRTSLPTFPTERAARDECAKRNFQ